MGVALKLKRVAIYTRVSTDNQTTPNQEEALREIAKRRGWDVVGIFSDNGISGSKGRKDRPGLDAMLKDASRRKFGVLMVWAIRDIVLSKLQAVQKVQQLISRAITTRRVVRR